MAPLFYNWTSIVGAAFVVLSCVGVFVAFASQFWVPVPYVGVAYGLLLALGVFGVLMVGLGGLLEYGRRRRGRPVPKYRSFSIDLSRHRDRTFAFIFLVLGTLALSLAATAGYQGVHAVETDRFCTETCHAVMAPEGAAHKLSGHSHVMCVDCHVGTGVGSFMDAKLNGLRQVYAVLTDSYDRPIKTPIHTMRDAREICESCHSPDYFKGYKEIVRSYYATDEESTEHTLRMLIKLGGKRPWANEGIGIHYAMTEGHEVEFIARDRQNQQIAWVRMTRPDGTVTEYNNSTKPLSDEERETLPVETVGCLDCHNRPAHRYLPPTEGVNYAIESRKLSRELPFIKLKAVEILSEKFPTTEAALAAIAEKLPAYYEEEHPEIAKEKPALIIAAVNELQAVYQRNFFPSMGVSWRAYPENIGHRDWPGCFRCHNDEMVDADDKAIFSDCLSCHVVLQQNDAEFRDDIEETEGVDFETGRGFYHFGDDDTLTDYTLCSDCHTGDSEMYQ